MWLPFRISFRFVDSYNSLFSRSSSCRREAALIRKYIQLGAHFTKAHSFLFSLKPVAIPKTVSRFSVSQLPVFHRSNLPHCSELFTIHYFALLHIAVSIQFSKYSNATCNSVAVSSLPKTVYRLTFPVLRLFDFFSKHQYRTSRNYRRYVNLLHIAVGLSCRNTTIRLSCHFRKSGTRLSTPLSTKRWNHRSYLLLQVAVEIPFSNPHFQRTVLLDSGSLSTETVSSLLPRLISNKLNIMLHIFFSDPV